MSEVQFKNMSNEELAARVNDMRSELLVARTNFRLGKFKKSSDFGRIRKEIARTLTEINSRSEVKK